MYAILTIAGGLLLIVLESVLLRIVGLRIYVPEIAVILVVYVSLRRDFTVGAMSTLIFGAFADQCWGGPRGFYVMALTILFFVGTLIRVLYRPRRASVMALLCIPATLLTGVVALGVMLVFRGSAAPMQTLLSVTPLTAVINCCCALPLYWILGQLDGLTERQQTKGVAL